MTSRGSIIPPSALESARDRATLVRSITTAWRRVRLVYGIVVLAVFALVTPTVAQPPATNVDDHRVYEVASHLRCVVCQNLSVADSPSEMAQQMRGIVRERLAAGESPEQVVQYFVDKYGEWILLAPRRRGFMLIVWLAPLVAVVVGVGVFTLMVRRWTRPRPRTGTAAVALDPAMRERIRRELEVEGDR